MGPDRPQDSFGLCLVPNHRFSTRLGPNLMFFDRTRTLVSQDWTWADLAIAMGQPWGDFGPTLGPLWAHSGPTCG